MKRFFTRPSVQGFQFVKDIRVVWIPCDLSGRLAGTSSAWVLEVLLLHLKVFLIVLAFVKSCHVSCGVFVNFLSAQFSGSFRIGELSLQLGHTQ